MPRGRTLSTLILVVLLAAICTQAASAGKPPKHIVFPVVGKVSYIDDFGDARHQGRHEGNDIMASKKQLVVAAESGRVEKWTRSANAGCMLYLHGASGTTYLYIHLNNDRTMRNDNRGGCKNGVSFAPGLRNGMRVRAGQLLGYVGDSGDANGIHPHLHFELHPHDGRAVSPYRWLRAGRHLLFAAPQTAKNVYLKLRGKVRWTSPRFNVHVLHVRASTGRGFTVVKNVAVNITDDLVVQRQAKGGAVQPATLSSAQKGDEVLVWTNTAAPTLEEQLGAWGSWDARRILIVSD
jgi:hypothetical protein